MPCSSLYVCVRCERALRTHPRLSSPPTPADAGAWRCAPRDSPPRAAHHAVQVQTRVRRALAMVNLSDCLTVRGGDPSQFAPAKGPRNNDFVRHHTSWGRACYDPPVL
jgi:hypothetical protein